MRKIDRTLICYGAGRRMHARLGDTVRVAEDIVSGADASDERWDDLLFMLNRLQVSLGEASVCDPKSANRYDDASAFIISSMKHRVVHKDAHLLREILQDISHKIQGD